MALVAVDLLDVADPSAAVAVVAAGPLGAVDPLGAAARAWLLAPIWLQLVAALQWAPVPVHRWPSARWRLHWLVRQSAQQ